MKSGRLFLPILAIALCAPLLASAAGIDIPAQPLSASLQELSKRIGVQFTYAPGVIERRDAPALNGVYSIEGALDTLLAKTNLTYHVLSTGSIEILNEPIDEVTVKGKYEKLTAMKKDYEILENRFYDEYNKLNADHEWDVRCNREMSGHFVNRVCTPVFISKALQDATWASLGGHAGGGNAWVWVQAKIPAYQENLRRQVARNPKLLELLMKRNAAAERYASVRKKKFEGGKIFVWD
jgi:hypothetical protein